MGVTWDKGQLDALNRMLLEVWEHNGLYLNEPSGRPIADPDADDLDGDGDRLERLTFSETVGYKLFMEALMASRARTRQDAQLEAAARGHFDRAWQWAQKHLQRRSLPHAYDPISKKEVAVPEAKRDALLAWRYVPDAGVISHRKNRADGAYIDGLDGAPDGDLFTFAALRIAAILWPQKPEYFSAAKEIARDIHAKYVGRIGGDPYLLGSDEFIAISGLNPSYSFEAIYDMLGEVDPPHAADWQQLKQTSMKAAIAGADAAMTAGGSYRSATGKVEFEPRRVAGSSNLPPNWVAFDGKVFGDNAWFDSTDWISGWDGLRTLWMKAASFLADGNEAARRYLQDATGTREDFGPYGFLKKHLEKNGSLPAGFGIDGSSSGPELTELGLTEPNAFSLGIYLGYFFAAGDKAIAAKMLEGLTARYHPKSGKGAVAIGEGTFAKVGTAAELDYFGDYWAWFGMAMAAGMVEEAFARYQRWRTENGMAATVVMPCNPDALKAERVKPVFKRTLNLMQQNEWISPFDRCSWNHGGYLCKGRAKDWYVGGVGIGIGGSNAWGMERRYDGIFVDVDGLQGRVKLELHTSHGLFTFETPAAGARELFVPFTEFRKEIDHQPKGKPFDPKKMQVGKFQVIALGATADGPVDFRINRIRAAQE